MSNKIILSANKWNNFWMTKSLIEAFKHQMNIPFIYYYYKTSFAAERNRIYLKGTVHTKVRHLLRYGCI